MSLVAFSPLGRGFLSGQLKSPDDFDEDDMRRQNPRFQGENFKKNLELADKIKEIADKKGVTSSQLCLAWLLAKGTLSIYIKLFFVYQHELHLIKQLGPDVFVIPGTRKEKYLLDNVASASITLTTEEMAEIRHITQSFSVSGDRYNPTMMAMVDKESSQ